MSAGSLPIMSVSTAVLNGNAIRKTVDFVPSIWGDHFLRDSNTTINHGGVEGRIQMLKLEVKRMMLGAADDSRKPMEKLNLVDEIQRLGIAYRFEKEIDQSLEQIHKVYFESTTSSQYGTENHDLNTTALLFRLLRQQGYRVSCDVFHKFKDMSTGSFKESLVTDPRGLLSLYEASQLAHVVTLTHLKRYIQENNGGDHHSPAMAAQVRRALKQCLRKGLTRVEARHYISVYDSDEYHNNVLLALAKLDFNLLQKQHQKELEDVSSWWKELDFLRKLPFARDRVVECYFWILGLYFEPQYSLGRSIATKIIMLTSVMDDIYDVYGTPEELQCLTGAIERWDGKDQIYQLPEYIQVFYTALLDLFDDIEEKLADVEGKTYRLFYAKESMKLQPRAFYDETKWLNQPKIPTFEEYMSVAMISSGYVMLVPIALLGMGELATEHAFKWSLGSANKIVTASATIFRLMDDIVSHKFEQERQHVPSAVECYMKQYGMSEQQAKDELWKKIDGAWKDINEECLRPYHDVPEHLLARILNLTQVIDVLYKDKDRYTHPDLEFKQLVASLLVDPIPS